MPAASSTPATPRRGSRGRRIRSSSSRKIAKSLLSLLLTLCALEAAVRFTDYDREILGDPFNDRYSFLNSLVPDTFLQWRGRPGRQLLYDDWINASGFRGPAVSREKPPGILRVAVLGDSCTFGILTTGERGQMETLRPYPALLQQILDRNFGSGQIQVMNFGMIGYSSYHGLRVLRREVLPLDPDFVVIRFGWNDLLGSPAGRSFASMHNPWLEKLEDIAYRSRLFALLMYRGAPMQPDRIVGFVPSANPIPWVTEDEYAWNLSRMIDLVRAHGATPILLDAPAAPITPEMRANKKFIGGTGFETVEQYLAAHDRYQAITERVAREKDVRYLRTAPTPAEAHRYFTAYDIPHPNQAGQARIAYRLNAELTPALLRALGRPRAVGAQTP